MDKAVCARRADGLFVEVARLELAAFDARDLRADQRGAVLEILRAILRPDFELSVMRSQSLEMLRSLARALRTRRMRLGTARRRSDIPPFRSMTAMSRAAVAPSRRGLDGGRIVAGKEARLQLADPVPALAQRQIRVTREMPLDPKLVELPIVKGAEMSASSRGASGSARAARR